MKTYAENKISPRFARLDRRIKSGFTLVELLVVLAIILILATLAGPSLTSIFGGSALSQAGQMIVDQLNLYRQLAVNNNYVVEVRIYNFIDSSIPGDATSLHPWCTPGHYRGIQAFKVTPVLPLQTASVSSGPTPQLVYNKTAITKPLRLPPSVIIDAGGSNATANNNISYLIKYLGTQFNATAFYPYNLGPTPQVAPQTPTMMPTTTYPTADPPIFNVGYNYTYVSFQFEPDGSTNLTYVSSISGCFMTLHARSLTNLSGSTDFLTVLPKNFFMIQIDPTNGHAYAYRP